MKHISLFMFGLLIGTSVVTVATGISGSDRFPDVATGAYYDDAVGELAEVGVIRGNPDGSYKPGSFVTRAEVAVMLKRLRDDLLGREEITTSSRDTSVRNISGSSSTSNPDTSVPSAPFVPSVPSHTNPAGSIRFTIGSFTAEEGDIARITVIRTGGNEGVVSVAFALSDGTATAGEDYLSDTDVITFADGETNRMFTVRIANDEIHEESETIKITLSNPTGGAGMGMPVEATLIVEDDDEEGSGIEGSGTVGFSALAYSMGEDKSSIDINVVRVGGSTGAVAVEFATTDGTARDGVDYDKTNGRLDFADGETEETFTVYIDDDSEIEGNEHLFLRLINPSGGTTINSPEEVRLTIVDDEILPFAVGTFRFSHNKYSIIESGGELKVTVERVGGADGEVSVDYATSNIVAREGDDYEEASGTLTFLHGEVSKSFFVPVIKDGVNDPDETFRITLSNSVGGAGLGDDDAVVVTIVQ